MLMSSGAVFAKDEKPVVWMFLYPERAEQFDIAALKIGRDLLQGIALLVDFPVMLAVKPVDRLFDPGTGEMKDPSAEFGDMHNIGPHGLCIRQADYHIFPRHPGHFTKGPQGLLIGQMLQHLKGADAVK